MISASAVGYYGSHPDGSLEFAEGAPPGDDFLASLCCRWEEEAAKVTALSVRLIHLRIGLVLARGGGALPRMLLPFRFGLGGPVGSGKQVISWIHLEDLIDLIRFLLSEDRISGPINAVAPHPVTNREFAKIAGMVLHRPAFIRTPALALRLALGEMANLILLGQKVIPARSLETGFPFRYPVLEEALGNIMRGVPHDR
jgi:uncharacterized protein (TIGR01777 family)